MTNIIITKSEISKMCDFVVIAFSVMICIVLLSYENIKAFSVPKYLLLFKIFV